MVDLNIKAGETISACKTSHNPEYKASLRLNKGDGKKSTSHSHLNLHAQTQGVVLEAVMAEGDRVCGRIKSVEGLIRGEDAPRVEGQSDKARLKELRLKKRAMDNEIGDLRESEAKRMTTETTARHQSYDRRLLKSPSS